MTPDPLSPPTVLLLALFTTSQRIGKNPGPPPHLAAGLLFHMEVTACSPYCELPV
jgi:hypothetical protein